MSAPVGLTRVDRAERKANALDLDAGEAIEHRDRQVRGQAHQRVVAADVDAVDLRSVELRLVGEVAIVCVESTLEVFGALVRAHLRWWRVLGSVRWMFVIMGFVGKTTTRVAT